MRWEDRSETAAAPATVSDEPSIFRHWENSVPEGDSRAMTREPGDLPSEVVTRDNVGRGVQTFSFMRAQMPACGPGCCDDATDVNRGHSFMSVTQPCQMNAADGAPPPLHPRSSPRCFCSASRMPMPSRPPAPKAEDLPEIVAGATGIETPADQIANSVTVITGKDMERDQRRTVPDALSTVPGLNVVQNGGPGGSTSIFIRGANANHQGADRRHRGQRSQRRQPRV